MTPRHFYWFIFLAKKEYSKYSHGNNIVAEQKRDIVVFFEREQYQCASTFWPSKVATTIDQKYAVIFLKPNEMRGFVAIKPYDSQFFYYLNSTALGFVGNATLDEQMMAHLPYQQYNATTMDKEQQFASFAFDTTGLVIVKLSSLLQVTTMAVAYDTPSMGPLECNFMAMIFILYVLPLLGMACCALCCTGVILIVAYVLRTRILGHERVGFNSLE